MKTNRFKCSIAYETDTNSKKVSKAIEKTKHRGFNISEPKVVLTGCGFSKQSPGVVFYYEVEQRALPVY